MPAGATPEQRAVLDGYRAFWVALIGAAAKADPQSNALAAASTGAARTLFLTYLNNELFTKHRTHSGPVTLAPTVATITGTKALVTDCGDFSLWRVRDAAGQPVNKPDPRTTAVQVGMVRVGQRWIAGTYQEGSRGCRLRT